MNTKLLMRFFYVCLIVTTIVPPADAWLGKKQNTSAPGSLEDILNIPKSASALQQDAQVLQTLSAAMTQKLQSIETMIAAGQTKEALSLAKSTLDDVRIKTGIDPKANLRQRFLVPTIFPEGASQMSSLSYDQKNTVIRTIRDFQGGLYLDILNLSKRTSLQYIKAFHAELVKSGGLMTEDRNKIIKDLALASKVALQIQDQKGAMITVYDNEVANEDHIYLFNREIKSYLLNAKDLRITEEDFDRYKNGLASGGTALDLGILRNGARYKVSKGLCYNADASGQAYGYSVEDQLCSVGYRASNGRCYNRDIQGTAYGYSVEDQLCNNR